MVIIINLWARVDTRVKIEGYKDNSVPTCFYIDVELIRTANEEVLGNYTPIIIKILCCWGEDSEGVEQVDHER